MPGYRTTRWDDEDPPSRYEYADLEPIPEHERCPTCNGVGCVRVHGPEDYGVSFECEDCEACHGTGRRVDNQSSEC